MLETGGHRSIDEVPARRHPHRRREVPGRAASRDKNDWSNLDLLTPTDEVKFVIKDRGDYEFARDVVDAPRSRWTRAPRCCSRRCTASSPAKDLAAWILADRLPVRLQLQAHKYIWSPDTRGV